MGKPTAPANIDYTTMSNYHSQKPYLQTHGAAPPPYSDTPNAPSYPPPDSKHEHHELQRRSPSPNPQYHNTNPFNLPQPQGPRLLHIYIDGLSHRNLTVCDSDKTTPLYTLKTHTFHKPQMEFYTPTPTDQLLATAAFGSWTNRITLSIHGRTADMSSTGFFSRSKTFASSIGVLKWEYEGVWSGSMACVTERGELVARFIHAGWSVSKTGKIEVVDGGMPRGVLDEVVVSGLAMAEHERRRRQQSAAASAGT